MRKGFMYLTVAALLAATCVFSQTKLVICGYLEAGHRAKRDGSSTNEVSHSRHSQRDAGSAVMAGARRG